MLIKAQRNLINLTSLFFLLLQLSLLWLFILNIKTSSPPQSTEKTTRNPRHTFQQ